MNNNGSRVKHIKFGRLACLLAGSLVAFSLTSCIIPPVPEGSWALDAEDDYSKEVMISKGNTKEEVEKKLGKDTKSTVLQSNETEQVVQYSRTVLGPNVEGKTMDGKGLLSVITRGGYCTVFNILYVNNVVTELHIVSRELVMLEPGTQKLED